MVRSVRQNLIIPTLAVASTTSTTLMQLQGNKLFFGNSVFTALTAAADNFINTLDLLVISDNSEIDDTIAAKIIYSTETNYP
jgi:hypothetical protein